MTNATEDRLIPAPFLFRFSIPCRETKQKWTVKGLALDESYQLPSFAQLDDQPPYADVRLAWSAAGIALNVRVSGKRRPTWCRESRLEDSDGVTLRIDTRDTQNVHRATRFCHAFTFMPSGSGGNYDQPVAAQMLIDRAKEQTEPAPASALKVRSEQRVDGYLLEAFIEKSALQGYDPEEHHRLSFHYSIDDRELGQQALTVGGELPHLSDPSLWSSLELVS